MATTKTSIVIRSPGLRPSPLKPKLIHKDTTLAPLQGCLFSFVYRNACTKTHQHRRILPYSRGEIHHWQTSIQLSSCCHRNPMHSGWWNDILTMLHQRTASFTDPPSKSGCTNSTKRRVTCMPKKMRQRRQHFFSSSSRKHRHICRLAVQCKLAGLLIPALSRHRLTSTSARFFRAAENLLSGERGAVRLASVQARLLQCFYLLTQSRINHCWSLFGTLSHLALAIGLNRGRKCDPSTKVDYVEIESRRRLFWVAYSLDKYLAAALGRPRTFKDEDIDQVR